jgi:hypothetical protein
MRQERNEPNPGPAITLVTEFSIPPPPSLFKWKSPRLSGSGKDSAIFFADFQPCQIFLVYIYDIYHVHL